MTEKKSLPVLVVGAGIAGVTVALESAEAGREVLLVEGEPTIGGRVVRMHHYFPKCNVAYLTLMPVGSLEQKCTSLWMQLTC